MLDDLRRIIESEMEYDDLNDIMMEATDNAIADMFIEEDGEAIISDAEVMGILEKIPEYDEETAMNKKLARIAEAYIPEELSYVEEGLLDGIGKSMKVKPMVHVANIQFGMKRSLVNKLLLRNKQEKMEDPTLDAYKHLEIKYDDNDKVMAVKIIGLESDIIVNGLGKVSKNFDELCNLVMKVDPEASISDDRCTSNKLAMRAFGDNGETKTLIFGVKNLFAVHESFDVDDDLTYLYEMFDLDDLIK